MHETRLPAGVAGYLDRRQVDAARVIALTGDASERRYFRVIPRTGPSFVLAQYAQPFDYPTLPFAIVARLFAAMPIPVPRLRDEAADLGVLALDDLGDDTLQAHLGAVAASGRDAMYERAVGYLAIIQARGRELAEASAVPFSLAFDVEKLMWEMDFFLRHFLAAHRGVDLSEGDRVALRQELQTMVEELAAEPRVLCHRDYHSRNLMVSRGELYVIDFQDARMGPNTYDLVSLLRDSYVDLEPALVDRLIALFRTSAGVADAPATFQARFDLMALQRNLKALGTFGYQATTRDNPVYAQYIPRTLRYVGNTLRKYARFDRLRERLAGPLPELR